MQDGMNAKHGMDWGGGVYLRRVGGHSILLGCISLHFDTPRIVICMFGTPA